MRKDLWIRLKKYRFENLAPVHLWDKIASAFGEEDAFTRAFAAKIARKLGWDQEFAFLAIREYKKFIYLGITSLYEVTPPKVIDQVWHEHMLFTRGYREFCETVLERHFDHSPELIPFDAQTNVFNAQYRETLARYEQEFGCEPPEGIWGRPKFNRTAVTSHDVLPRRKRDAASLMRDDDDGTPLYTLFSSPSDTPYAPIPVSLSDHHHGGHSSHSDSHHSAPSDSHSGGLSSYSHSDGGHSHSDAGGYSDSSSSGGDSSGGSGCSSSSCGGGGGCGGS